jgi:hypothetical protein
MSKAELTIEILKNEAGIFAKKQSKKRFHELHGVTDGKAVGTYIEHEFKNYLSEKYFFERGNSASGIDFRAIGLDVKVTSIKQPQSSCPFKSARQKIFGLGYSLLIFVYEKTDEAELKTAMLNFLHVIFVEKARTADYQMTHGLLQILDNGGNKDDLTAFMSDKNLPIDDIEANLLAEEILRQRPVLGYLTISNALQWRLQYSRVIQEAERVDGVFNLMRAR